MKFFFISSFILVGIGFNDTSTAQVSDAQRQRRRAFVEDLLQGLIESQNQPAVDPNRPIQNQPHPHQPNLQPQFPKTTPSGQATRPGRDGRATVEVSPEMVQARQQLERWSASSRNLVDELRFHEHESPQLRPYLADAIKIQASIEGLKNRASLYPTLPPLVNEFAAIDRDWRVLAYRLKQTGTLTGECRGFVDAIIGFDSTLCELFRIEPQLDRNELLRLTTEFSTHYKHLLQDVYYQTRGQQGGDALVRQGQELYSLISQATAIVPQGRYDSIVSAFQNCTTNWQAFNRKLRSIKDPRIARDVQEIELLGRQIREQLWLPIEMDREYVAHLADSIYAEAGHMFSDISLTQILTLPEPERIFDTVRGFQNSSQSFSRGVTKGKTPDELAWDFWLFEKQWFKINNQFKEFKIPAINQHLDEVAYMMTTMGQSFGASRGQRAGLSHQELVQIAANLDQLSHRFNEAVHQRVDRKRYDAAFHQRVCTQTDALHELTHEFHKTVIAQPNGQFNANQLQPIFATWDNLRPSFNEYRPEDQFALSDIRRQIEPMMVKLQVVFAE